MKRRIVIWGLGGTTRDFMDKKALYKDYEIVAFTDNNPVVWHTEYMGVQVIEPSELKKIAYDYVYICSQHFKEIRRQLVRQLSVDCCKIISCFEVEEALKEKVIEKYNSDCNEEIQGIVDYLRHSPLNIYGSYTGTKQRYLVHRDQNNHPYIMFNNLRMYFPDTYIFMEAEGNQFVEDILYEQGEGSPHQYIAESDSIKNGDIIVDAGVCEGNFSLCHVEKAKKIYLIESDPVWLPVLERTFQPFRDKVVICSKFLTRYDSEKTITIDSLVSEKIDFIKMDIEGAEIDALLGAKRTLKKSNARCAICSYHKQNDEENIRFLLETLGYHTSVSKGYMFFMYDENIVDSLDLRKGIVYGKK